MLAGENDSIAAMATISSVLAGEFPYFFWTGFYRLLDGGLVIGPYQGTPGCLRIALDRGVCGAAASSGKTMIVDNVHDFPGHIACDSRSQSEIVVPVKDAKGEVMAVLDVDSTELAAFDAVDQEGLEKIVALLMSVKDLD
ncbi:MAG: GAF domain-containing protein [Akkermansiaceae bacterium]